MIIIATFIYLLDKMPVSEKRQFAKITQNNGVID
jgi:hypothetical protein